MNCEDMGRVERLRLFGISQRVKNTKKCPRCGDMHMSANVLHNALSKYAEVYICDACGADEAIRAYSKKILPMEKWAYFKPGFSKEQVRGGSGQRKSCGRKSGITR